MVPSGRLAANVAYLTLGHAIGKASALVSLVFLARYLGEDDFGQLAFAVASAALFEAVGDVGVSQAIARDAAGQPARLRAMVVAAIPIKFLLAFAMIALAVATGFLTGARADLLAAVFYVALAHALLALVALARATFEGAERMEYEALSIALEGLVRLMLVLYSIFSGFGILGIAKAYAVAAAIVLAATAIVSGRRFLRPLPEPLFAWRHVVPLLASGLPFAGFWLLGTFTLRADIVLMRPLAGDSPTGLFAAAVRLLEPTLIIPTIFATAILPLAARHHRSGLDTIPTLLGATQKLLFLASGMILALTWVLGADLVAVLLGPDFAGSVVPAQVLAVAVVALFAKYGLARLLFAVGRELDLLRSQAAAVLANLVLVITLVPLAGATGAAIAVAAAEALGLTLTAVAVRDYMPAIHRGSFLRPIAVVVVAVAWAPLAGRLPTLGLAVLCVLAYMCAFAIAKPLSQAEFRYLRSSLSAMMPSWSSSAWPR